MLAYFASARANILREISPGARQQKICGPDDWEE